MENTTQQYLKYKGDFKKVGIFKTAAGAAAIISMLFFLFIPSFLVQEKLFGKVVYEQSFSVFDELINSFKGFGGKMDPASILGIYQILATIYLVVGLALMGFELFKSITGILNLENYSIAEYDKIKKGEQKARGLRRMTATNMLISACVLEIVYIMIVKMMSNLLSGNSEADAALKVGFINMNALSWNIMFAIIFFIAFIALTVIATVMRNKIKVAILKEDYGVSEK